MPAVTDGGARGTFLADSENSCIEGELEVREARIADLDAVISMLEEAARWMVRRGIEGWTPDSFSRGRIADLMEGGEMYLAVLDGQPVGTFALQWEDRETWGSVPEDAGYVHGLAIRRECAGMGLGREILRRAEQMVSGAKREYLRLDCVAHNEALNEYYRRSGFGYRGRAIVRGLAVSLYEKRVGVSGAG
jgi:ribosomal protein S18 acetylase RimI-like enzyme